MKDLPTPSLSVVVPTYNGRHLLEACLSSLERYKPAGLAIEVIVVDDASTDGTGSWLPDRFPWVRLLRRKANAGFVATANDGLAAASSPIVQLLNNDAEVSPGWAEAGLRPFADPRVGSVAPLVLMRGDPSKVDSAGDRYTIVGWPCKRGHGQAAEVWSRHASDWVFGASASSAFYRAEALRRTGGFDPAFGSYYEDVDLAFRLRWAGYHCVYEPSSRVLHDVSATYDHSLPELQRRMSRNAELLFWSNLPSTWLALAACPHLAFVAAQAVHRALRGRVRPFLAGKRDAFRSMPAILARRSLRTDLASQADRRPHFPITASPAADLARHLARKG